MMTTKIEVPAHLHEYLAGKYCSLNLNQPVRFPDGADIYHQLFALLERRPISAPVDRGNLEICLPNRGIGKPPETYNYLGLRSTRLLVRKIELMMWADAHEFIDDQKHRHGIIFINSIHTFMTRYGITSISEDAFLKNYYRWRKRVRAKETRAYNSGKKSPSKRS